MKFLLLVDGNLEKIEAKYFDFSMFALPYYCEWTDSAESKRRGKGEMAKNRTLPYHFFVIMR